MDILSDKVVTTRKDQMCNACGRIFPAGTKMRTQVNTYDGIRTWRECPTCYQLLIKHPEYFEGDDGLFNEGCVLGSLERGQTPEQLLEKLNNPCPQDKRKRYGN